MSASPIWLQLLPSRYVIAIATLGPVGRVRKGPGTAGTAVGLVWFTLFFYHGNLLSYLLLGGFSIWFAIALCGEAEVRLGKSDPSEVVLDEFVAVPFCFLGLHPYLLDGRGWAVVLAGFVLFRLFDIAKPFGIARLQKLPGGAGVVVDDLAAAVATCLCLHLLVRLTPFFG
jgi:phosphatidylglycerophosphatase A